MQYFILDIAITTEAGNVPEVYYHSQCRNLFTLKKSLECVQNSAAWTTDQDIDHNTIAKKRGCLQQLLHLFLNLFVFFVAKLNL